MAQNSRAQHWLCIRDASTVTFATLPAELLTQATGIYSLMRNIGSAIGSSVTGALLPSNTQVNHALITEEVTPFNRGLRSGAAFGFLGTAAPSRGCTAEQRGDASGQHHRLISTISS
jgi:hypothetical protein